MTRVAILISGRGSNMDALVRDMIGNHPARPVLVLSNVPEAKGLRRAREMDVETAVVSHRPFRGDRAAFEAALTKRLETVRPDIICLSGFMRILTPEFIERWSGRILNIHPSLLPKYPGLDTHARAIAAGDDEAGCTVHEVTDQLDAGPVLGQARVPINIGDTADALAARVLTVEHQLYPAVLRRFAIGDRSPVYLPKGIAPNARADPGSGSGTMH
ncbi:MAG: phosphoribosylglycinamide formyltransferase [Boseongicola sp. SB0675_bin_26]|nr:phosphoribosylglycinamide formyltransferase [Boseongicola sp. SB0675_bin_26]